MDINVVLELRNVLSSKIKELPIDQQAECEAKIAELDAAIAPHKEGLEKVTRMLNKYQKNRVLLLEDIKKLAGEDLALKATLALLTGGETWKEFLESNGELVDQLVALQT